MSGRIQVATPSPGGSARTSDELLFIGQRCSHDACNLVDFLPLKVRLPVWARTCAESRAHPPLLPFDVSVSILPTTILWLTFPIRSTYLPKSPTRIHFEPDRSLVSAMLNPNIFASGAGSQHRHGATYFDGMQGKTGQKG